MGGTTPNGVQTMVGASGNVEINLRKLSFRPKIIKVTTMEFNQWIALEIEARHFTAAVQTPEAKNMIVQAFSAFRMPQKGRRPKDQPKYEIQKLGVLGAGMMVQVLRFAKAGMDGLKRQL